MYERIPKVIKDKNVLEIATGPSLLVKHVSHAAKSMITTDDSEGMIQEAKKRESFTARRCRHGLPSIMQSMKKD